MRNIIVFVSLLFTSILGSNGLLAQEKARPNFLIILVDDLRWDELACTGHPFARTPHMDRIAREGARFRNAFVTTPLCSPSRASFLSGLYAHSHGITDNTDRSKQSHQLVTFPRLLQDSGYETGYVGKWHMGNDDSARPGFDYWICMKGQGSSNDPTLNENGVRKTIRGYTTDILNDRVNAFLRRKRQSPFCLYVAHKALHPELTQYDDGSLSDPTAANFIPAPRHQRLYSEAPVPRRLSVLDDVNDKPALARKVDDLPRLGRATGTSDKTIRDRQRMLAAVDDGVGQIFQLLEENQQLDNTVIILASDNGYFYGEHGLSVERRLAYEEAVRIPLLIRYPRAIRPGTIVDQMALNIDMAPTILEIAGIKNVPKVDGRSLVPLLGGQAPSNWRKSFLIEYYTDSVFPRVRNMGYKALRTQHFKYIHYTDLPDTPEKTGMESDATMDELYDLKKDPYEMDNLIKDRKYTEVLLSLRRQLKRLSN